MLRSNLPRQRGRVLPSPSLHATCYASLHRQLNTNVRPHGEHRMVATDLIVIVGGSGTGKTTLARALQERLLPPQSLGGTYGGSTTLQAVVAFPHAAKQHQYKPNAAHWRSRSSLQGWQDSDHRKCQPARRSNAVLPQPR